MKNDNIEDKLKKIDSTEKRLENLSNTILAETIKAVDAHIITAVESCLALQTETIINQKLDRQLKQSLNTRINNSVTDRLHDSIANNTGVISTALQGIEIPANARLDSLDASH